MPPSINSTQGLIDRVSHSEESERATAGMGSRDIDSEFGGREARLNLERKLVCKLDVRMSILILIYILNYVRLVIAGSFNDLCFLSPPFAGRQE